MNVFYDANGYKYPIDDFRQIHIPLKTKQNFFKVEQVENIKETKN